MTLQRVNHIHLQFSSASLSVLARRLAAWLLLFHPHLLQFFASLHWLPVCFKMDFKTLLLVFKVSKKLAPPDLSKLLHVHTPAKALRSSNRLALDVPRSRLKNRGDRDFPVAAPNLWSS